MQNTTAHNQRLSGSRPTLPSFWLQWFGVLAAPTAWATHLSIEYFFVTLECQLDTERAELFLHVATPLLLALSLAGGLAAAYVWRRASRVSDGTSLERTRFMAGAGLLLTLLFTIGILMGTFPIYMLQDCQAT